MTLPQYDGDSDPKTFLMKYEAVIESNGGDSATKCKALIMALKGPVQTWYTNLPNGDIYCWNQLRDKLMLSFRGLQTDELNANDFFSITQGKKESLQEYLQRLIRMKACR